MFFQIFRATFLIGVCTSLLLGYSKGPRPKHTGGYNESTCASCHSDFLLNDGRRLGGVFFLKGIPRSYEAGMKYRVGIVIAHPQQSRWGFQLSARFADSGRQAGQLTPSDDSTQTLESEGIQYIEQTRGGTRKGSADGPIEFYFDWTAPSQSGQSVVFNAAGNAADGSEDPTGDYIYTAGAFSTPKSQEVLTQSQRAPGASIQQMKSTPRATTASIFLHIPAPIDLKRGQWEVQIQHRFQQALTDSGPGEAFGLDSRANINLGLNYALTERLSIAVSRARFDQTVAFTGTCEIKTDDQKKLKMSLVGGVSGNENFSRHYSPFVQIATAYDYNRFRLLAIPTLILNSRDDDDLGRRPDPINPDYNHTLSLGLGIDLALNRTISFSWEYVPRMAGFGGFGEANPTLAGGVKIHSWGHVFSIMASTSRTFTPEKYVLNAEPDFSLGFNIYRRIR